MTKQTPGDKLGNRRSSIKTRKTFLFVSLSMVIIPEKPDKEIAPINVKFVPLS